MTSQPLSQQPLFDQPWVREQCFAAAHDASLRRRRLLVVFVFVVTGIASIMATTVQGQPPYIAQPMHESFVKSEKLVKDVYGAAKDFAEGRQANQNYVGAYLSHYLPAILSNQDRLPEVATTMDDFLELIEKAERGPNHAAFNLKVYSAMGKIAGNNYPPHARIAAIHALAMLNSQPADSGAKIPPVPWSKILTPLVVLYKNETNVDGIRAAALHGIHRHVSYGFRSIDAPTRAELTQLMVQLLDEQPPAGRSPQAHAYLQRFAVDILDKLRANGDPALGQKLVSISSEESRPSLIALHSAATLGSMGGELKDKIADPAKVLSSWKQRARAVIDDEIRRLQALDRADPSGGQPPPPGEPSTSSASAAPSASARSSSPGGGLQAWRSKSNPQRTSRPAAAEPDDDSQESKFNAIGQEGAAPERTRRGRTPRARDPKPGENQPLEVVASRRKINQALQQLQYGATGSRTLGMPSRNPGGLLASIGKDAQPELEQWVSDLKELFDEINSEYLTTRAEYLEMLTTQADALRELAAQPAANENPPAS